MRTTFTADPLTNEEKGQYNALYDSYLNGGQVFNNDEYRSFRSGLEANPEAAADLIRNSIGFRDGMDPAVSHSKNYLTNGKLGAKPASSDSPAKANYIKAKDALDSAKNNLAYATTPEMESQLRSELKTAQANYDAAQKEYDASKMQEAQVLTEEQASGNAPITTKSGRTYVGTGNKAQNPEKAARRTEELQQAANALNEAKTNLGYATDSASEAEARKALNEAQANYDRLLGKHYVSDEERVGLTGSGAVKGWSADMMNAGATAAAGLSQLSERLGGDTGEYAGWATDEVSRAAIPGQHDSKYYENQRQEIADIQSASDRLAASGQADIENAKKDTRGITKFAVDIGSNAIQMGMDGLAAVLTGGSSLGVMFTRSAGGAAREARNDGASIAQQVAYGAVRGGIEVVTEKMFDGLAGIYGAGKADDVVELVIDKMAKSDVGRSGLRLLFSGLGEAGEEAASSLTEPISKMIYQGASALKGYNKEWLADMAYSALVGFAMGGAGGSVNIMNGNNAEANAELRQVDAIRNSLADTAMANTAGRWLSGGQNQQVNNPLTQTTAQAPTVNNQLKSETHPETPNNHLARTQPTTPANTEAAHQAAVQRVTEIMQNDTVSYANANEILRSPSLIQAFEELTGETLEGNKTQMKEQIRHASLIQQESAAPVEENSATSQPTEVAPAEQSPQAQPVPEQNAESQPVAEQSEAPTEAKTEGTDVETAQQSAETVTEETANAEESQPVTENTDEASDREITPEMEEEERAANAPEELPPKGVEETLNKNQQQKEDALKKASEAQEQQVEEKEKPKRRKPLTDNEKILEKDRNRLERENKNLRRRVQDLAKQTKKTDVHTARESDVRKAARDMVNKYGSEADVGDVTNKLQALADYLIQHTGEDIDYDTVEAMADDVASDIVDNIVEYVDSGTKEAADDIRKLLKNNTINFGELAAQYSMEDAKSDFPSVKFAKTKGMSVQAFYDLLCDVVPESVLPRNINGAREQLQAMQDILDSGKTERVSVYENDAAYDQIIMETSNDIMDTLLGEDIRETAPTFADKAASKYDEMKSKMTQKVNEEKAKGQERLEQQKQRDQAKIDKLQDRVDQEKQKTKDVRDKKNAQLAEQRQTSRERLDDLRQQKNERMKQLREEASQRKKEAIAKEKAAKYEAIGKLKEHYKSVMERQENRRKTAAQRKKIKELWKDLANRVTKPTDGKYVPQDLMKYAVDVLESVDTDTGSASSAEKLNKLFAEFNRIKSDPDYSGVFDDVHEAAMSDLAEVIGGTPLSEMNSDQLDRVYNALKTITHEVKDGVKVKIRNEEHQASDIAKQMTEETKQAKGFGKGAFGKFNSWYTGAFSRATTFFERLGGFKKDSAWGKMAQRINDGQLKATEEKVRTARKFSDLLKDKRSNTLRKEVSIGKDASGKDIKVSRGMMISLRMLLGSEDGIRHIKYGGLTIPGVSDYYKGNNDCGFGTSSSRALGISPELSKAQQEYRAIAEEYKKIDAETNKDLDWQNRIDDVVDRMDAKEAEIDDIIAKGDDYIETLKETIDKQLTDYDKAWMDRANEYFKEAQDLLNQTTMDVYGLKKANVENYFPLTTDPNFRKASFESISRDMSLENAGFMKARVNAGNPILLLDISEVIASYSDKVANYTGIMPAVRDFQKVFGKSEQGFAESLQNALDTKFGKGATQYIEELMADIQGAKRGSSNAFFSKIRGNMAQAVLSLNPRVAFSQSASYLNAASEIGWAPLAKGLTMGKNPASDAKAMDLVSKYSPLMYYRTLGNSNAAMTDIQANAKFQNQMLKKFDFVMGWINMVDQQTVGRLWYASEAFVQQQGTDYAKGTDEYYQEVAKVFNRVVERTQPNYTTMQRAGILRNPSDLVKSMTMFMTQRLQNQNIMYEAYERLQKYSADYKDGTNNVTKADLNKAKKDMVNAVTSQVMSTASLVVMKAAVDAFMHNTKGYRDDDDELTKESIGAKIGAMFADSFIGNILGGSELYGVYNAFFNDAYYDGITISGIDTLSGAIKDVLDASKAKPEKQLEKYWKVAEDVATLFGIPLNNAERFAQAAVKWYTDISNGKLGTFDSDLASDEKPTFDFGDSPSADILTPVRNYLTDKGLLNDPDREIRKEVERLYEETGNKGAYPNITSSKSFSIDGTEYDLEGEDLDTYRKSAAKTARELAGEIIRSEAYKDLSNEQKIEALRKAYGYAKDLAKDEYITAHNIDTDERSTAGSLLGGVAKPGDSNDKTALLRGNLAQYIIYETSLKSNIDAGDYKAIDKQVTAYFKMNKNMQTVLMERDSELKKLVGYHNIGSGSADYFKVKESVLREQIRLDEDANTSSYLRLYAISNATLPESTRKKLVQDLVLGDSNFIGSNGKAAYEALSKQGLTVSQTAQFFDTALHCKTWKNNGEEADQNGTLKPDTVTFALLNTPGLTDAQRKTIYNDIRENVSNYYNDWGTYTWESEVKYISKDSNKASYHIPSTASGGSKGESPNYLVPDATSSYEPQNSNPQLNYLMQSIGKLAG